MGGVRAFRFGVQEHSAPSGSAWRDKARLVESLGYKALYLPDHFGDQLGPIAALIMGGVGGALCFSACAFKARLGYDDSLDVVGVHGVGGTWGAIATGLFATKTVPMEIGRAHV